MSEIEAEAEVEVEMIGAEVDATEIGEAAACGSCEDDEIDADADEE